MRLRRIEVENVRLFRRTTVIDDLQPGINIFGGPNGCGKSSFVAAIRAAFFERHRSEGARHLRPLDDPGAAPRVLLVFESGGTRYELLKEFLPRRRCVLKAGSQTLDGESAEDRLAALLGYAYAGRGSNRPENLGVPGLLWIDQGTGQEIDAPVSHAAAQLHQAITASAGAVASSDGDTIIESLRRQREALVTRAQGKPTGDHALVANELTEIDAGLGELEQGVAEYTALVDRLATAGARLERLQREQPWQAMETACRRAEEALQACRTLERTLVDARREAGLAADVAALVRQRVEQLEAPTRELPGLKAEADAAAERVAKMELDAARLEQAVHAAETAERAEGVRLQSARLAARRHHLRTRVSQLRESVDAMTLSLERARSAGQRRQQLAASLTGSEVRTEILAELRELERALADVTARIEAASTRISYDVRPGGDVAFDGQPIAGAGDLLLDRESRIDAPAMRLTITPGTADLDELRQQRDSKARRFAEILARYNVADIRALEARREAWLRAHHEDRVAAAELSAAAPEGLDALERKLAFTNAELVAAQVEWRGLESTSIGDDDWNAHGPRATGEGDVHAGPCPPMLASTDRTGEAEHTLDEDMARERLEAARASARQTRERLTVASKASSRNWSIRTGCSPHVM